ncbi:MAG: flagellar biosynthetic protein FliO [Nitrospirota bacterium]
MIEAYLQMAIALVAVVGIILVIGLFLRKKQGKTSLIHVLGYQSFGPRKGIAVLKIGADILLVGVTSTDLKLLRTFGENEFDPTIIKDITDKLNRLRKIKKRLDEQ